MRWPWSGQDGDTIRNCRAEVAQLDSDFRRLKAEWLDMYDKLTRRDERLRKREERAEKDAPVSETPGDLKMALRARLAARGGRNGLP